MPSPSRSHTATRRHADKLRRTLNYYYCRQNADLNGAHDALDALLADLQRKEKALRIALQEWDSWMSTAEKGYEDEKPTDDDRDVFAECKAALDA